MLTEVTGPGKVKGLEEVAQSIDDWDDKVQKLMKEFQTEVGELRDPIKIAVLTNMLPIPHPGAYLYACPKDGFVP